MNESKIVIANEYSKISEKPVDFSDFSEISALVHEPLSSAIMAGKEKYVLDRSPKPVVRFKTANNLDENGQIFYRPVTERAGTCTVLLYLARKWAEIKGKAPCAKDLLPVVSGLIKAEQSGEVPISLFSRSQNAYGRIGRTLAENAKLERLGGTYKTATEYGKAAFPYTAIIDTLLVEQSVNVATVKE